MHYLTGSLYHDGEPEFAVRSIREFWRARGVPAAKMRDLFYMVQRRQSGDLLTTLCLALYKTFRERGHQIHLNGLVIEDVKPVLIQHPPVDFNPLLEIAFEDDEPWMVDPITEDYGLLVSVNNGNHVVDLTADFFDIHDHLADDEHCPFVQDHPHCNGSEVDIQEFGQMFFTKMHDEHAGILEEMYEAMSGAAVTNLQTYIDEKKAAVKRAKNKKRKLKKRRLS